ncbi:MAG: triose-phosphate isomerase [Methanomassiliicoccales archaeon]|nr:triose-phosphate isomerase [Methanomassiliicoccales archaeon]
MADLRFPLIIVNFKAYREVEGRSASEIALACQDVAESSGVSIVACPPMVELARVASSVRIPVMSQHADPRSPGSATGWITPDMVKASGAVGTLVNHSEHRMPSEGLAKVVALCKGIGLRTCVCADTAEATGRMAELRPDMVAVEPPELIGGDVSVTDARPEVVSDSVAAARKVDANVPVLCGAGVKTGKDVRQALELGAKGVLLASGVVKAKEPRKALEDLVRLI